MELTFWVVGTMGEVIGGEVIGGAVIGREAIGGEAIGGAATVGAVGVSSVSLSVSLVLPRPALCPATITATCEGLLPVEALPGA